MSVNQEPKFENAAKYEYRRNEQQYIYDAFNDFIFSPDTRVLSKLIARTRLFEKIKDVPGDVVECGVFKGSGILSWLKIKKILAPNSFKKVLGFDFFETDALINSLSGNDKVRMKELFEERSYEHEKAAEQLLHEKITAAGFNEGDYELVKGDISETSNNFVAQRPGFKISLLYLDLDIDIPTYNALMAFWDRVSVGGLVVFDEYAYHQWSEAKGVDRFFQDKNVKIKSLDYTCPTAYVVKQFHQ